MKATTRSAKGTSRRRVFTLRAIAMPTFRSSAHATSCSSSPWRTAHWVFTNDLRVRRSSTPAVVPSGVRTSYRPPMSIRLRAWMRRISCRSCSSEKNVICSFMASRFCRTKAISARVWVPSGAAGYTR